MRLRVHAFRSGASAFAVPGSLPRFGSVIRDCAPAPSKPSPACWATLTMCRRSVFPAVLPFLLAVGVTPARAQDSQLKGLTGVRVVVNWTGGAASDAQEIQ